MRGQRQGEKERERERETEKRRVALLHTRDGQIGFVSSGMPFIAQ
jgi:hypothetical protein